MVPDTPDPAAPAPDLAPAGETRPRGKVRRRLLAPFEPVRVRITLATTLAFGLAFAGASVALVHTVRNSLESHQHAEATRALRGLASQLKAGTDPDQLTTGRSEPVYYKIFTRDGSVIAGTADATLPTFRTIGKSHVKQMLGGGRNPLRRDLATGCRLLGLVVDRDRDTADRGAPQRRHARTIALGRHARPHHPRRVGRVGARRPGPASGRGDQSPGRRDHGHHDAPTRPGTQHRRRGRAARAHDERDARPSRRGFGAPTRVRFRRVARAPQSGQHDSRRARGRVGRRGSGRLGRGRTTHARRDRPPRQARRRPARAGPARRGPRAAEAGAGRPRRPRARRGHAYAPRARCAPRA